MVEVKETKTPTYNEVTRPKHYTTGKIEVVDFIVDQGLCYRLGNAVKYICRCNHKGNKFEDLLKARQYIDFVLDEMAERLLDALDLNNEKEEAEMADSQWEEQEREVQQTIEEDLFPESYTQTICTAGEDDLPDREREQEHCTCVSCIQRKCRKEEVQRRNSRMDAADPEAILPRQYCR